MQGRRRCPASGEERSHVEKARARKHACGQDGPLPGWWRRGLCLAARGDVRASLCSSARRFLFQQMRRALGHDQLPADRPKLERPAARWLTSRRRKWRRGTDRAVDAASSGQRGTAREIVFNRRPGSGLEIEDRHRTRQRPPLSPSWTSRRPSGRWNDCCKGRFPRVSRRPGRRPAKSCGSRPLRERNRRLRRLALV